VLGQESAVTESMVNNPGWLKLLKVL